ncbi:MAG: hypothetical protein ACOC6Q_00280 [Patescibacteria group bacterium]
MENSSFLRKLLDRITLGLMVGLLPLTLAVVVSWNAVPGEVTYPLKLSVENMAVFVSQIHPPTEMELRLVLLSRRYQEARDLLETEGSPRGYEQFTKTATATRQAVLGLSDELTRERYVEKVRKDLEGYQRDLEILIEELNQEPKNL